MKKTMTSYIQKLRANYDERDVELFVTNGVVMVSIGLRNQFTGVYANMTPDQAREAAGEMIARADEIDAIQAERVGKE